MVLDNLKIWFHNKYVGKVITKVLLVIILILGFTFATIKAASADSRSEILGASTEKVQIPPTVEGPGLLLPDSPLFFLDQLKQNVRLFLAFAPENKAKVYTSIASERLAELRFMLAKNNRLGIQTDLMGIADNFQKAAQELSLAQLSGKNVSDLAKTINNDIKQKQQTLDILENQTRGEIKTQTKAVSEGLMVAKIKVEDALPAQELENEIRDDLNRQIAKRVVEASESAQEIRTDLDELQKGATEAAKNSLKRREEALKKAIKQRNEVLQKVEERLLENEKKKQENLLRVQQRVAEQAQETIKKAQESAQNFQKAQLELETIRNQPVGGQR